MLKRIVMAALAWIMLAAAPANLMAKAPPTDEPEVVRLILDSFLKKQGARPTYESIERAGGAIILRKVSFIPEDAGGGGAPALVAESVSLENPTVDDAGLHRIARIVVKNLELRERKEDAAKALRVFSPEIVLDKVSILPLPLARNEMEEIAADSLLASGLRIDDISFRKGDGPELHLRGLNMKGDFDPRTGAGKGVMDFGRMVIPADLFTGGKGKNPLRDLGYDALTLTGGADYKAEWDDKRRMRMDFSLRLGAENAGEQEFAITDLAIPLEVMKTLNDRKSAEALAKDLDKNPGAAMRILDGVTLRGLRLAWIDHSLTGRILDKLAREKGLSREAYAETILAYPQVLLMQLGLPKLAAEATPQLRAFLKDPKSLSISMAADAPMDIKTLTTLMADPAGLVETLNLKVEANTLK